MDKFLGVLLPKQVYMTNCDCDFDCDLCWPMIGLEKLHKEGGQDMSTLQLLDWKVDSVKSVEELLKKIWIMLYMIQT